jgi:hypothetical protein
MLGPHTQSFHLPTRIVQTAYAQPGAFLYSEAFLSKGVGSASGVAYVDALSTEDIVRAQLSGLSSTIKVSEAGIADLQDRLTRTVTQGKRHHIKLAAHESALRGHSLLAWHAGVGTNAHKRVAKRQLNDLTDIIQDTTGRVDAEQKLEAQRRARDILAAMKVAPQPEFKLHTKTGEKLSAGAEEILATI